MKRRDFLKVGAFSAFALLGMSEVWQSDAYGASAGAVKLPSGRKIDIHAHAMLPAYTEGLKKLGIDPLAEEGFPLPQWSAEAHLAFMAEAGIDYTVLSLATPHIYNGDEELACEVARQINEETADLCRQYPDKFGFVATVPFPSIDGSLQGMPCPCCCR